jgi:hypothetical protein
MTPGKTSSPVQHHLLLAISGCAAAKDDVRSVDFVFDRIEDVLDVITLMFVTRSVTRHVRSDHRPEIVARARRSARAGRLGRHAF